MLVSETNSAKQQFCDLYPGRHFTTVDYYSDDVDLKLDLCAKWPSDFDQQYDAIVCQATFEHLYDPVTALKNLTTSLKGGGYLFLHTVIPGFVYHRCPEDYFRFFPDWFLASERFCDQVTVTELVTVNTHIFAAYLKCQTTQSS
jgi:2-polyprenyl-3-methyl-5-hydroxy-6-metoxy-1,4-benzoquinol methylase